MTDPDADDVLLVEDELFIALDLQETIEEAGFRVVGPCATIAEAHAEIDRGAARFAVAVLDVRLADGTVFPAADRLHAAGVPLLFHSGHADDVALRERYPSATVCPKPSAPDVLAAALKRCADQGRVA
ncbi:response regulator [Sphingomonas sp. Leaf231]|uniref:response regulator n=1 Tax=Sphingomonas sp. Leaf231 TaxID=1736301 RepID=UPI000B086E91|nr:response regulator [Sphingomonas sp. Leaf231]